MTKICVSCETKAAAVPFTDEFHSVEYRDATTEVGPLSGFRCPTCGEVECDRVSAERYAAAGDALVLAARKAAGEEPKRD